MSEFQCKHCGVALVRPRLVQLLEQLRVIHRQPIIIVSGYRCPPYNQRVGGARNSQHMYGAAADILAPEVTYDDVRRVGFTGVGLRNGKPVHVDVRDGAFTSWSYPSH